MNPKISLLQPQIFSRLLAIASPILVGISSVKAEPTWITPPKESTSTKGSFSTTFTISKPVSAASLRVAASTKGNVQLNAENLGAAPAVFDVKGKVLPALNTLAIEVSDGKNAPQAIAILSIEFTDGTSLTLESDQNWTFTPSTKGAAPTQVTLGQKNSASSDQLCLNQPAVTMPADIAAPAGFKVELLHRVPKIIQGSWVSMTVDQKGRLICGDQYGGLYRVTPAPAAAADTEAGTHVEKLHSEITGAHGLLYAFDSLYVMVGEGANKGIHRLTDTDNDDQFDKAEFLIPLEGGGEHGPHSLVLSPDKKRVYFCAGNHTKPPAVIDHVRGAKAWSEDHLLPRLWDANGHAKGILAPGGYIASIDPDGKNLEMFCYGYRNEFDFAFNLNGDIFTYDSDMEWDIGTPWYRPTRINHSTSGADFGWRSGAGKWPSYYPDSLPATVNIGPGSPTGVCSGTGAKFPAKYQKAIFANDWTYGTMYALFPTPDGGSYQTEKTEFVSGKPLSVTDVLIHPTDGAMYFAVGGRRNQSALYRVTYVGPESTAPVNADKLPTEAKLRRELEALHVDGVSDKEAIQKAWPHLSHKDRFVRFAARVAIEKQPSATWSKKALSEKNPQAAIEALIALARVGDASLQPKIIAALSQLEYKSLATELKLPLLRAWQLVFTRMGMPSTETSISLVKKLDPLFPQKTQAENNELLQILVYLGSKTVVSKAVSMMQTMGDDHENVAESHLLERNSGYAKAFQAAQESRPIKSQMAFAYTLRNAKEGWNPDLRKTYFSWFTKTSHWKGGNSFAKFLVNIRNDALETVADAEERTALEALSKQEAPKVANLVMPQGPGKAYTVDDIVEIAKNQLSGRSFERGKAMYATTQCATCHHFAGDGGNIGPDLTGAAQRYSIRDMAESIVEPSKVISDQYAFQEIYSKDGSLTVGRVIGEENGKYLVMTNPFAPDATVKLPVEQVESRKEYGISPMPPGLVNMLGKDELLDLIAFLFSGGDRNHKAFAQSKN